jgi:hypothetical protein
MLRSAAALALVFVFAAALAAGVIAHIGLPSARRAVAVRVNDALASASPHPVRIERIEKLNAFGFELSAVDADIPPVGRVRARDVAVQSNWVLAAIDFFGSKEIRFDVRRLTIGSLELPDKLCTPLTVDFAGAVVIPSNRSVHDAIAHVAAKVQWGHAEARLSGNLDHDRLNAELDVPGVSMADLAALVPAWPLPRESSATLHAAALGTLRDPRGHLEVRLGAKTRVTVTTEVHVAPSISGTATIASEGIDLGTLSAKAPQSDLGVFADLRFAQEEGVWVGTFSGRLAPGRLSTRAGGRRRTFSTPPATFQGRLRRSNALTGDLTLTARDRGTSVRLLLERQPEGATHGTLNARIGRLQQLGALRPLGVSAAGAASVHADVELAKGELNANLDLGISNFRVGKAAVGTARATVSIAGESASPFVRADITATNVRAAGLGAGRLEVHADGPADSLRVRADGWKGVAERLHLSAVVHAIGAAPPGADEVSIRVVRNGVTLDASADRVARAPSGFVVQALAVYGLGRPIGVDLTGSARGVRGRISAPAIDLSRAGQLAGIDHTKLRGTAHAELAIEADRSRAYASLHTTLAGAAFGDLPPLDGGADALVDGDQATLGLRLYGREMGSLSLDGRARTDGSWLSTDGLARARGRVVGDVRTSSLERLCRTFGCPAALAALTASAQAHVDIERAAGGGAAPTETTAVLHVDLSDPLGQLLSTDVSTSVDMSRWLQDRKLPLDTSFRGQLDVPQRALSDLPAALRPPHWSGAVGLHASGEGTLRAPNLQLQAKLTGLRARSPSLHPDARQDTPPMDAALTASYDSRQAKGELVVHAGGATVIGARAAVAASLNDWLGQSSGGAFDWTGNVFVEANRFPLSLMPRFVDRPIAGELSGQLSAERIHANPVVSGKLRVEQLRVGAREAGSLDCGFSANADGFLAEVKAMRAGPALDGSARGGLSWQDGVVPTIDLERTIFLDARANGLDLGDWGALLIPDWELAGSVSGQLHAEGTPRAGLENFRLSGDVRLTDASVFVPPLGRSVTGLSARAVAFPSGRVFFEGISGALGSGSFHASGAMTVAGSTWSNAHFDLEVPRTQALPVLLEGVDYGTAWGKATLDATNQKGTIVSKVDFPTLHFELTERDTGTLASTDRNPHVAVAQPLDREQARRASEAEAAREAAVGGGPQPKGAPEGRPPPPEAEAPNVEYVFDLHLGKDVGIRRGDTQIDLGGNPIVKVDGDLEIDGYVTVLGGRVSVLGKTFRVDRGIVRFAGRDPADPSLDVDASYQAQGAEVTVHLGGTAKQMKLDLKSDPPYSQSEILALIAGAPVGGQAGATAATGGVVTQPPTEPGGSTTTTQSTAQSAAGAAGGMVLTSGLNQILSGSIIPIQASVGSSTAGTTKASAAVNVTERVRVEYIRQFGTVQYGTQIDLNSVAIDWQLSHAWVLRTLVGDRGTTILDVLWQRRY